jgi:hypothetical protein
MLSPNVYGANWRDYSWRQLELSPDFQSLPTQNIYIEKPAGRDWKKKELGESSNYSHSLTLAGTKESLVKESLQNGTIKSLPLRR